MKRDTEPQAEELSHGRRDAESFARYHEEHAGYGGAGREFHERACTFLRTQAEEVDRLRARERQLVEVVQKQVDGYDESGYDGVHIDELRAALEKP